MTTFFGGKRVSDKKIWKIMEEYINKHDVVTCRRLHDHIHGLYGSGMWHWEYIKVFLEKKGYTFEEVWDDFCNIRQDWIMKK